IDWRLRQDPRVVVLERTNIRYLERLPDPSQEQPTKDERRKTKDDAHLEPKDIFPGQENSHSSFVIGPSSSLADCATIDVSFISLKLVLPAVQRLITPEAWVVALIKPQFEAGVQEVSRGEGVIRDPAIHRAVLGDVLHFAQESGLRLAGLTRSPI